MSGAELHRNAGVYTIRWPNEGVTIRLDRLRSVRDTVTAEMVIRTDLPGPAGGLLHHAREPLLSTASRRTLARHLSERCPDVDWTAILQEACTMTLASYRESEPVIELHEAPPRSGPRWLLEPFILDRLPNMIYGDGAVGKSMFALWLAALLSSGRQTCGLYIVPCNVLYLDYETTAAEMGERLQLIEAGLEEAGCSRIEYRCCCQPLVDEAEELQALVAEHGIELVIIDSMGLALGQTQGDPRIATVEYFRALRSLNCATLTIDHISKDKERSENPYGSVYKSHLARNMWEMRKQQTAGKNQIMLGLYHRKANFGPLRRPLGFRMSFDGDAVYVQRIDVRNVPELAAKMTVWEQIQAVLRHGAMTVKEIADELGIAEGQVRVILNRYQGRGVRRLDGTYRQGVWGLEASEEGEA